MNRHDRALELWQIAHRDQALTPQFIYRYVVRNLALGSMQNYAIPYEGSVDHCPYGHIPHSSTICRTSTRSVMVAKGVRANENPNDCVIWAMCGNSLGGVVTPLWVRAGSVPVEYDGHSGSSLAARSMELRSWIIDGGIVNTFKLCNEDGTAFWDYAF